MSLKRKDKETAASRHGPVYKGRERITPTQNKEELSSTSLEYLPPSQKCPELSLTSNSYSESEIEPDTESILDTDSTLSVDSEVSVVAEPPAWLDNF